MYTDHHISSRRRPRLELYVAACIASFIVLWPHIFSGYAAAQSMDTARTVTLRAPETGVIYVRSGLPGAVRIRSRHTTRRNAAVRRDMTGVAPTLGETDAIFNPADLLRLEALLARQGLDFDVGRARRGGEDVVVLRRRTDRLPTAVDTLSLAEAARLIESVGGRASLRAAAPASVPPLVTRIERSLLDAGLFRSFQVNFEFDRSELLVTADPTLDAVTGVLERFPDLRIEVAGHADNVGPEEYNRRLSAQRAEQVRRELIERGIEPERIRAQEYGESRPLLSNRTPTGRAMNRRVEFVVLNPEAAEQYRLKMEESSEEEFERLRQPIRAGIRKGFEESRNEND